MEKKTPYSDNGSLTQVKARPYSEHEMDLVRRVAQRFPCRWRDIEPLFPGRTRAALSKMIANERRALGIGLPPARQFHATAVQCLDKNDPGKDDGEFDSRRAAWKEASLTFVERLAQERRAA